MAHIKGEEQFLDEARKRYRFGCDADAIDRAEAENDYVFANATDADKRQWDDFPRRQRELNHRPVLQWNRLPAMCAQVMNDGRANKPAIKVSVADGGVKETAEFFQSRIRAIEYDSDADIAYDRARETQILSGRGFIRVYTEWVPGTFKKKICIEGIENQFSVVFDPASKKYDRSDADWCFVVSRVSREKFRREYGEKRLAMSSDFASLQDRYDGWFVFDGKNELIQIAEYWCKKYRKRTLCSLKDGTPIWKDELEPEMEAFLLRLPSGELWEREEEDCTVMQYVIDGCEILEQTQWEGSSIPIVPIWGREAVVDGIRRTYSLIRNAKDPQRLVNLYVSNIAEQIAMMPKAPYEASIGSIAQNHEPAWRDAGLDPRAILYYQQYDEQGRPLERPSRVVNEPPIQALTVGLMQAIDGIKAAMGIYDASLGARSNETTGRAIEQRKKATEIVNFHFSDNEARSRKRIGEILIELIPLVDLPGMHVPVRSEDGKTQVVPIGEPYRDERTGQEVTHNPAEGNYGVTVSTGPSYNSAREEEHERLVRIVEAQPDLMTVIGDQVIRTSDFPGSDQIADRMERWINKMNPGIIPPKQDQKPIPPEVQQYVAQLEQELKTTQAFAQSLHEKLETKQPEIQKDLILKDKEIAWEREKLNVETRAKLDIEAMKKGIDADIAELKMALEQLKQQQQIDAASAEAERGRMHEESMADKTQAGVLEQQQQAAELAPKPNGSE